MFMSSPVDQMCLTFPYRKSGKSFYFQFISSCFSSLYRLNTNENTQATTDKSLIINKKTPVCTHVTITNTSAEKRKVVCTYTRSREKQEENVARIMFRPLLQLSSFCHLDWVRLKLTIIVSTLHSFRFIN